MTPATSPWRVCCRQWVTAACPPEYMNLIQRLLQPRTNSWIMHAVTLQWWSKDKNASRVTRRSFDECGSPSELGSHAWAFDFGSTTPALAPPRLYWLQQCTGPCRLSGTNLPEACAKYWYTANRGGWGLGWGWGYLRNNYESIGKGSNRNT